MTRLCFFDLAKLNQKNKAWFKIFGGIGRRKSFEAVPLFFPASAYYKGIKVVSLASFIWFVAEDANGIPLPQSIFHEPIGQACLLNNCHEIIFRKATHPRRTLCRISNSPVFLQPRLWLSHKFLPQRAHKQRGRSLDCAVLTTRP